MRRIAFFTPGLDIGGIERVFITYAEAFTKEGYDVSYVVCKNDGAFMASLPLELKIVSLGNRQLRNSIVPLYRYLKKNPVDYLISGSIIANALCVILGKLSRTKTKIILSHHNYFNIEQQNALSSLIIGFLYNRAHRIFSVSEGITKMLLERHVKPTILRTIYNPIDISAIKFASNRSSNLHFPEKYLLFLGRLGEVKNLLFLLESFQRLHLKMPDVALVFIGEGPMMDQLVKKTEELNIKEMVYFTGTLSNPFPVLNMASAVVLPSYSEALPTVVLESFALGKTVVATPTNGAVDLLENGLYGYISKSFDDVDEFSLLLEKGLLNPFPVNLLEEKAEQYTVSQKIRELETLFV